MSSIILVSFIQWRRSRRLFYFYFSFLPLFYLPLSVIVLTSERKRIHMRCWENKNDVSFTKAMCFFLLQNGVSSTWQEILVLLIVFPINRRLRNKRSCHVSRTPELRGRNCGVVLVARLLLYTWMQSPALWLKYWLNPTTRSDLINRGCYTICDSIGWLL